MRILSLIPEVQSLAHEVEGKVVEFLPDAHGAFDVPEEVGRALTAFPHWVQDLGQEAEKVATEVEGDVHAELAAAHEEITKLKALLESKTAPAKTADKADKATKATKATKAAAPAAGETTTGSTSSAS